MSLSWKNLTFKGKALITIIPVVVVAIFVIAWIGFQKAKEGVLDAENSSMKQIVLQVKTELDDWMTERLREATLISKNQMIIDAMQGKNITAARKYIEDYLSASEMYENLVISDAQGNLFIMGTGGSDEVLNMTELPNFVDNYKKAKEGKVWIGKVAKSPVTGLPVVFISVPVERNGQFIGLVGAPVELDHFHKVFMKNINLGSTGYVYLVDSDGTVLAHPNKDIVMSNFNDQDFFKVFLKEKNGSTEYIWQGSLTVAHFLTDENTGYIISSRASVNEFLATVHAIRRTSIVVGVLATIIVTLIVLWILNMIFNTLNKVIDRLKDISQGDGDLTQRINYTNKDEIGELSKWFNIFVQKIQELIKQVKQSATEVGNASSQISSAAEEMASGSEEQQSQLSEVATSIEEMSAMILESSKNAGETQENANQTSKAADEGRKTVQETIDGIKAVASITSEAAKQIAKLENRSNEIGEVIQVIDDIADQTNLLALNANIEAARAGEAGRGFAVVADEVRKLAERTVKATAEIGEKINLIQSDVKASVEAMNNVANQSSSSQEIAAKAGEALERIIMLVGNVTQAVIQIASAADEQSAGAEEISKNVEGVSTVAKQAASSSQELASSAEQLNREVKGLNDLVSMFKVG